MNRRTTYGVVAIAAFGLLMLPVASHSQNAQQRPPAAAEKPAAPAPAKSMKEAIVGSWSLLIDDAVKPDGTHTPNFGPNPIGLAMFGPDGHFSVQIMRAGRPKFASNNRATGTADENKAAVAGANAFFGTYTLNEGDKTLTMRIEGGTYPNLEGTQQKRTITSLTAGDELTWTNPATHGEVAWKFVK
jgi:hypothetical protein